MSKSRWANALAKSEDAQHLKVADAEEEQKSERQRSKKGHLRLSRIKDREKNTRGLNQRHVAGLAESIAEVGLIQPIAIDEQGVLLAGGHRLAALRLLQAEKPEAFARWFDDELVPVNTIVLGEDGDSRALAIEISENEKRRDYTASEVQELAARLREAGYVEGPGAMKTGEKHIVPALALVLGKSLRTARRMLAKTPATAGSHDGAGRQKELAALLRCERGIEAYLLSVAPNDSNKEFQDALRLAQGYLADTKAAISQA